MGAAAEEEGAADLRVGELDPAHLPYTKTTFSKHVHTPLVNWWSQGVLILYSIKQSLLQTEKKKLGFNSFNRF